MNILPQDQSLGDILGSALSDVAGHFAGVRTARKALQGLGFSDAEAKAYAHLGPQIQQQAIANKQHQLQQQASNETISRILGQGLPSQQYSFSPMPTAQQPSASSQQLQPMQLPHEQQQAALQQATGIAQNPAFRKLAEQQQAAQALQQQQLAGNIAPQAMQQQPITGEQAAILQAQAQQHREPTIKDQIEQVRAQKRALAAANLPVNQTIALHQQLENREKELRKEAREERREEREERKLSHAEQAKADKETLPVYQEVNKVAKAAKDSNIRLGRMEELINKGKVQTDILMRGLRTLEEIPYFGKFFEVVKQTFTNPDTQEFEKLSADFVKDAKQFFGNRITQQEVALFLKTVPSLMQSAGGQKRVIRNMRIFNEAAQARQKAMNSIIKENGGKRPRDLEELIEERTNDTINNLANEFKQGPNDRQGVARTLTNVAFSSLL